MKSNYKSIGNYIQETDVRNFALHEYPLMGLSVSKKFIPSIANIVGTDMKSYKVVQKNQFTYTADTSRRGDKIAISLSQDFDNILVSQIYTTFEIIDENKLNPEYLMMWFRRPEFDRYARFKSHGSAREIFDWEELCETLIPVPSISTQRAIVAEYNALQNRINNNQKIIQKFEETAQAVYKEWFVENRNEGWEVGTLSDLIIFKNGKSKPNRSGNFPVYGGNGILDFVNEYNEENVISIGRVGAYCGSLHRELGKCWISDNAISAKSKINCNMYSYYVLAELKLNERSEGTGQPLITQGLLNMIEILIPRKDKILEFEKLVSNIYKNQNLFEKEIKKINELKTLLLSKLAKGE